VPDGLVLKEGRETALSARDLNCSDQFKPSPERVEGKSDVVLDCDCVLACVLVDCLVSKVLGGVLAPEGVLPLEPGLPLPPLALNRA